MCAGWSDVGAELTWEREGRKEGEVWRQSHKVPTKAKDTHRLTVREDCW